MIDREKIAVLIKKAKAARERAFMVKSERSFGACVFTRDGQYFDGCNIGSVISGLGICAERCAINHAVAHRSNLFQAVAVVSDKADFPCGVCLQYLMQFYKIDGKDIEIIASDLRGHYRRKTLLNLLPEGYRTINKRTLAAIKSYRG